MKWALILLGVGLLFGLTRRRHGAIQHVAILLIIVLVVAAEALTLHAT